MKSDFEINNVVTSSNDIVYFYKMYQALTMYKSLLLGPKHAKMNSATQFSGVCRVQWQGAMEAPRRSA